MSEANPLAKKYAETLFKINNLKIQIYEIALGNGDKKVLFMSRLFIEFI